MVLGGDYTYGNKVVAVISMLGVSRVVVVCSLGVLCDRAYVWDDDDNGSGGGNCVSTCRQVSGQQRTGVICGEHERRGCRLEVWPPEVPSI
jgi:hypothetical protein